MQRFESRVVAVTGGGGGIGGAACRHFAAEGAVVAVLDMDNEAAEIVASQIREHGGQASAVECDITARASIDAAVSLIETSLGPMHVLVNCAGWDVFMPFMKTEPIQWDKLIAVNLTGPLHMHHAVLPHMSKRRVGRIVNIASDAGRVGSPGQSVYSACKGGLISFTKTIALEHARHGITVNVVSPGPIETALFSGYKEGAGNPAKLNDSFVKATPLGRIGQPVDVTGAILFLASEEAGFITGQVMSVSGGLTMVD